MNLAALNRVWQVGATAGGPVILTLLILRWWQEPAPNLYTWLCWLHLPLLMLHETEEYVFPGGFVRYMNTRSVFADFSPRDDLPLNEPLVFFTNIGIWIFIILGALLAEQAPYVAMAAVVLQILNLIAHPIMFQFKNPGYNPGLVTTLVILLPYMTFMFWYVITHDILGTGGFILAIAIGVGFLVVLVASSRIMLMRAPSE
jgi:hypothetical protein